MSVEKVFIVIAAIGGFSLLTTNIAVTFQIRNKIIEVTNFIQNEVSNFIENIFIDTSGPIPEPNVVWYRNAPDYVNVSITFFSSDPLYMLKTFEAVTPDTMSGSEVLLSHLQIQKSFLIKHCTSGPILYRRFLELDLHEFPLTLNVSLIRNRK